MTEALLHEEFQCLGYFGFGGGYSLQPGESYCNTTCPVKETCWAQHKARVAGMFPTSVALFEQVVSENSAGQAEAIIEEYRRRTIASSGVDPQVDPYVRVFLGNVVDGMHYAETGTVKDRGPFTLNIVRRGVWQ